MTIHRDWVGVMKAECPEAFTPHPPLRPRVAFIDGMPSLMKGASVCRWHDLIGASFMMPVKRFFGMGAHTVVLGFDVYSLVPSAKSITQDNRTKKVPTTDFDERDQLPPVIPVNYNDCIRNRAFKRRVVQLIVETLPDMLALDAGQALIIDYENCPVQFRRSAPGGKLEQVFMVDVPPLGECDIKCTRWFRLYGDGIAQSVDGDFLPIALLEHESQVRELRGTSGAPTRMAVYRLEFNTKDPESSGKKRAADGAAKGDAAEKRRRAMEFVNIPLLYESMCSAIRQCAGTGRVQTSHDARYMEMLACLIGLTGTDFTRNLPLLGVRKVWDMLPGRDVWSGIVQAYDTELLCLDVPSARDQLVGRMYYETYRKHIDGPARNLSATLLALQKTPCVPRTPSPRARGPQAFAPSPSDPSEPPQEAVGSHQEAAPQRGEGRYDGAEHKLAAHLLEVCPAMQGRADRCVAA